MRKILANTFILFNLAVFIQLPVFSQSRYQPTWESLDQRPIPAWFQDAKLGIFIHWGVYSVPSFRPLGKERYASYAEWYQVEVMHKPGAGKDFHQEVYGSEFEYRDFAPLFKAELFNTERWAKLFKNAGAKYVVLTSKHHDGYTLWPSSSPWSKNWNSLETGPGRDLVGELTTAVRSEGLKMGLYFSLLEWETPTPSREEPYLPKAVIDQYRIPAEDFIPNHIIPQLKELVQKYQPALIFSDGAWDEHSDYWQSKEFLAWLYNQAPNKEEVVVNDRWGKDAHQAHGDYFTSEYASEDDKMGSRHPWEENQGIGGSYGLNRAEHLADYKSAEEIVEILVDRVSRGGNLLLNVGPAADGTIPVIQEERLLQLGSWMEVNGEAIYGSKPWKIEKLDSENGNTIYFTRKNQDLYLFSVGWPEDVFEIELPGIRKVQQLELLGYQKPVKSTWSSDQLQIFLPKISPENRRLQYVYTFKLSEVLND